MSTITVDVEVEVEVTAEHLESAGFHHRDDCDHSNCNDYGDMHHSDGCNVIEENNAIIQANKDALHDWHETAHGYTIWSGCQQEPCNQLTPDFRKRA